MAKGARGRRSVKRNPKKEEVPVVKTDPSKILFIALGVAVFLLIFYFITLYITSKNSEDTDSTTTDTSEVRENMGSDIILGRSLSMSDEEYYVLFYDMKDEDNASTYDDIASNYRNVGLLPLYTVDMSSGFNKNYATDGEANRNPSSESELLIHGPTLIHVLNGQVTEYLEGEEDISSTLH